MKNFDYLYQPYPSQRQTVIARNGMVATSQPLAAQAGLDMLKKGGNAIDAAVATAAALTVVEPTSNGIGGDAFALVWVKGELFGLNASGPSPSSISVEAVKEKGYEQMPMHGMVPITVPGAPSAWAELSRKFGKLPFSEVLEPAIRYAKEGYPITPVLGKNWHEAFVSYKECLISEEFKPWFDIFAPNGRAPEIGEMWSSPCHASTLQSIAKTNGESFYRGEIAEKMSKYIEQYGGFLTKEDLAIYHPQWVKPISVHYRGYDVWEIPPNGQGLVALMALNIAKGFDFYEKESVDTYHKHIESMKLAFTDGKAFIAEENCMPLTVETLLSEEFASTRRKKINQVAIMPEPYCPPKGGTVYIATADHEGNMVSFIQSNYKGFGSGIVIPGTGIALQNRGYDFSLEPTHPNCLAPHKKTYHTIIPGFITKNGEAIGPFGVMGEYMQPQGQFQVITNMIDFHLNPQAALDAPRWQWIEGKKIMVEMNFPKHIAEALVRKGHDIQINVDNAKFGRGQIIWRDTKTGVLFGGTESRTDGSIAAW
ncbi:gamma-glutamyltranspeptidase/glutathione hydrolase [Oikeobacillus pervagus]|uniref:Gamma-glutamyltranspeptidase/glutathione hydrolase n=1 Tax=Oikeobacillus pervagus TaxID=1325931 RepID=A0AAJ1WJ08_9BACI|nr:gamma-glutamyltransferase family protein [Oikeobacillus pervagus]MDQ0214903.1 gamma-glutamyltranspeptidase/glutathione hydrolase [Oikeobacillus pervagus]